MLEDQDRERNLNSVIGDVVGAFKPPEDLTVTEWADKYRMLSQESSAESGRWRTSRTPYLADIMDAFTDPNVRNIVFVSASQVGKSELINNCICYIIDQDPGTILFIQPSLVEVKKYSQLRIEPMIRDTPRIRRKVRETRSGRDNSSTILRKSFPGGMLMLAGSNEPAGLASTPARYVFGDERDRWAPSAGKEGDPWELSIARQATFFNAKTVQTSTPTVKGASNIATAFEEGTRERWHHLCPHCGKWFEITFNCIHFEPIKREVAGRIVRDVREDPVCTCPHCGGISSEQTMRRQPQKWIAEDPDALKAKATRSFWLSAFASPWVTWRSIAVRFLNAKDNPRRLQVVYNTLFGELWEDRGDMWTEDEMLQRREDYGTDAKGNPVELPDGVLVLTCGVDTQDDRLEYEVVGHGRNGQTGGVEYGVIRGRPDDPAVWERLDDVIDKPRKYRDGMSLKVSMTFVDSGGHFTQEVYNECRVRRNRQVFAIRGVGGEDRPYVPNPKPVNLKGKRIKTLLFSLGVDAGKTKIMDNLLVESPDRAYYCHFPTNPEAGYDIRYFESLISEHKVRVDTERTTKYIWAKLPGHVRNEALDCRNYANAALRALNPSFDRLEKRRKDGPKAAKATTKRTKTAKRRPKQRPKSYIEDW